MVAVVKTLFSGLLAVVGLASIAWGVAQAPATPASSPVRLSEVVLRRFPVAASALPPTTREPDALKPSEVVMPEDAGAPEAAGMAPQDAGAVAVAVAVTVDAGVKPVTTQTSVKPDAGVRPVAVNRPAVAVAVAKPDAGVRAAPPPPPSAPVGEGTLNLQASDTADVFIDGRKVGASPVLFFKVKAGAHKVRFDCYDEAGNAVTGTVLPVTVGVDEEQDVSWTCVAAQ